MPTTEEEAPNNSRLPAPVRMGLADYLTRLDQALPGQVGGLYLHGSTAQEGFNEHYSDLDLIAVLNAVLDEAAIDCLEKAHDALRETYPHLKLEVHYLQWGDLGRDKKDIPAHPYYKTPLLSRSELHHLNPFTWWYMKRYCVALRGPQPEDLPFEVDWQDMWEWNRRTLQRYWIKWTRSPRNLLSLWSNEVAYWSVLGICRLYYNLRERDVVTKEGAGRYALAYAPARYERVLREALRIRAGERDSYYANRLARAVDVVRFLNFMTGECQQVVQRESA